jgi:HK97 family phage prohead protease
MRTEQIERRMGSGGEIRVSASPEQGGRIISGYALIFNSESLDLGGFREVVRPEAIDRSLRLDVLALADHDSARVLGRVSSGTLRLTKDARGLRITIDLPETSAGRDVYESVRRRDVRSMSFGFSNAKDEWTLAADGTPLRHLYDLVLREVSVVTFPAYTSTSVDVGNRSQSAARSLESLTRWHRIHAA